MKHRFQLLLQINQTAEGFLSGICPFLRQTLELAGNVYCFIPGIATRESGKDTPHHLPTEFGRWNGELFSIAANPLKLGKVFMKPPDQGDAIRRNIGACTSPGRYSRDLPKENFPERVGHRQDSLYPKLCRWRWFPSRVPVGKWHKKGFIFFLF